MSNNAVSEFKRLAGMDLDYGSWRRPDAASPMSEPVSQPRGKKNLSESFVQSTKSTVSISRAKIRRMASMLEEDRFGGTRLQFDWEDVERLTTEAHQSPEQQALAQHHWDARLASTQAHEVDKGGDPKASHNYHRHAAEKHRVAAKHLAASGDTRTARVHDQWAQHHDQHAAHHAAATGGVQHSAHAPAAAPAAARAASPNEKPKAAASHKSLVAPEVVRAQKGTDDIGDQSDKHVKAAQQSARVAHHLAADKTTTNKELAAAHKEASHDHLHAALSLFHSGHHDKALQHFNAAIHHMNKHKDHKAGGMAKKAASLRAAGPQATAGRTAVPGR